MWSYLNAIFQHRSVLIILLIINLVGTVYGFYWYRYQLEMTEPQWIIFVPDSPTASLVFTVVLFIFLLKKNSPFLEAFAAITLFKYGIWAVVMIILGGWLGAELTWQHGMLIFSHLGMALQAWIYTPFYVFTKKHILLVAGWTLFNDVLDYTLDIHPWLAQELEPFDHWVGLFTVLLSLTTVLLFLFSIRIQQEKLRLT